MNERSYLRSPEEKPDSRLLAGLMGNDAVADRALSLRTRRAVYNAGISRRGDREQGRRNLSVAVLITGVLIFALAPTVWAGLEDMMSGDGLTSLPGMLIALCMTLFAAVAAVLFMLRSEASIPQPDRTRRP